MPEGPAIRQLGTTAPTASNPSHTPAVPDVWVLALGGAGKAVAERLRGSGLAACYWRWERDTLVEPAGSDAESTLMSRVPERLLAAGVEAELESWVSGEMLRLEGQPYRIALLAGLGGATGSSLLPLLAGELQRLGLCYGVYVTEPFRWEDALRRSSAEDALAALARIRNLPPRLVRLDNLVDGCAPGTPLDTLLAEADGRLERSIRRFLLTR